MGADAWTEPIPAPGNSPVQPAEGWHTVAYPLEMQSNFYTKRNGILHTFFKEKSAVRRGCRKCPKPCRTFALSKGKRAAFLRCAGFTSEVLPCGAEKPGKQEPVSALLFWRI